MSTELISINPATNTVIHRFSTHSDQELDHFAAEASKSQKQWRKSSLEDRKKLLLKLAEILQQHAQEDAVHITAEMGKPIAASEGEIRKCASLCIYYAEHLEQFLKDELIVDAEKKSAISFQPLGVLLGIMPWNFPFWQVIRFAVPAIAAGNTILLKHASNVSASALLLEKRFLEAGFPSFIYKALLAKSTQMEQLIRNPLIKGVSLTGSERAGADVARIAGEEIKPSLLELGGNDAYLIFEDADLELAVKEGLQSRMKNAGQSCIGAKRFIVMDGIYDAFRDKLLQEMNKEIMGSPLDEATTIGPMVSTKERDRLHEKVQESVQQGARLLLGGQIPEQEGAYYPPTLLDHVDHKNIAFREELFGPVCVLIKAKSEQEAIDMANDSDFGLGAALFTSDIEKGKRIIREELEAGACFLNEFVKSDPRLAFGGIKKSGYGREMGEEGIKAFVNKKYIRY